VLVDRIKIQERVAAGESISRISRETGIARSTVRGIVKDRAFPSRGEKAE
jgi:transposase